ncbi:hypothetical protein TNCV_2809051 [Trichonephila clavipes]|nr:hypothetical protein TNCV_2809051 [Trichonephila clavipes]
MPAEVTTIHVMRSSSVSTCVSYERDFRSLQKKKSKGYRSGQRGGHQQVSHDQSTSRDIHHRGGYAQQSKSGLMHHRA